MQARAAAQSADGTVQVGINLEKMMADQKATAEENIKFWSGEVENFTSMRTRTPEGDKIVCRAHEAARAVIKELYPEIKVGLTLSLHDIQSSRWRETCKKSGMMNLPIISPISKMMIFWAYRTIPAP